MRRVALVTGASSGIGLEIARALAHRQAELVLVARREGPLEEAALDLAGETPAGVHAIALDLAEPDAPRRLLGALDEMGLEITTLVNNAGFGHLGPVLDQPLQDQMDMIQVNVATLTELTALLLPDLLERGRGEILNVASTAAFQPGPGMAIYYATKAYVLSYTEALAHELRATGVGVTCLCPGPTRTGFGERAGAEGSLLFRWGAMSAERVAEAAVGGMEAGRTLVVPGFWNKVGVQAVRFLPRAVVRAVTRRLNR